MRRDRRWGRRISLRSQVWEVNMRNYALTHFVTQIARKGALFDIPVCSPYFAQERCQSFQVPVCAQEED